MNKEMVQYGKKIFFTVFIQGLLSIAAVVVGFGLPKFLSVEEYSRWQVYYFYVAYVNYLELGFNDGLILNLAGTKFDKLPWTNIKKSARIIIAYLLFISVILLGCESAFDISDVQTFRLLILSFIPTVLMCLFSSTLLAGNKTYQYNIFTLLIRVAFVLLMLIGIIFKIENAAFYVLADIVSKVIIIILFYLIERKNITKTNEEVDIVKFVKTNCRSGIVVASTVLILGLLPMCGRLVIQFGGNVQDYARYSFAISMLSIVLTFTNAIGTIAFPLLKNNNEIKPNNQYLLLLRLYDEILWGCFLGLALIEFVINIFLQKYVAVLDYFSILLAICWPLGKIQCIIYPYYKLHRKEKEFLCMSVIGLITTFALSVGFYWINGMVGLAWAALLGIMGCDLLLEIYYDKKIAQAKVAINGHSMVMFMGYLICGVLFKKMIFVIAYGSLLLMHYFFIWYKKRGKLRNK